MCINCWKEYGSPTIVNAKTLKLRELIEELYEDHCTGGALHIVTDDWNISPDDIDFCEQWLEEQRASGECEYTYEVHKEIIALMRQCSNEEIASALAMDDGFFVPGGEAQQT